MLTEFHDKYDLVHKLDFSTVNMIDCAAYFQIGGIRKLKLLFDDGNASFHVQAGSLQLVLLIADCFFDLVGYVFYKSVRAAGYCRAHCAAVGMTENKIGRASCRERVLVTV